jgi:hypothetical protein
LRVTEDDYQQLLYTPRMDDAVTEYLPVAGKMAPPGYSPFWEHELFSLDNRLSTAVRLGGVGIAIAEHLSRVLSAQEDADHPHVREAMLLCDLSMHLVKGVMHSRRRITSLRRQQTLAVLSKEFGSGFNKAIQDSESSQQFLFGGQFCEKLGARAVRIEHENLVRDDAKTVRDAQHKSSEKPKKKSGKSKKSCSRSRKSRPAATSSRARSQSSSRATSTTTPAASGTGRSASYGKRSAGGTSRPQSSKKSRRGRGGRT